MAENFRLLVQQFSSLTMHLAIRDSPAQVMRKFH